MKALMWLVVLLLAVFCFAQPASEPIRIEVGPAKAVTVTFSNVRKEDIRDIISAFFSRGDEQAKVKFQKAFGEATDLTLVITTNVKREGAK